MNETGSGTTFTEEQQEDMWDDRRDVGKCSEQMDENHPGVRKQQQRGRNTDGRGDHGGGMLANLAPDHLDLFSTRLRALNGSNDIDGHLSLGGLLSGTVAATYTLVFDSDNDADTGFPYGSFTGREFAVELQVTGSAGSYSISGLVRDLFDDSTRMLTVTPTIETAELLVLGNLSEGIPGWNQLLFTIPKDYIGLDITLDGTSITEIPVGVLVEKDSTIYDTDSFVLYLDRWLRDPLLETFGNGVPTPGEYYPFEISGLEPNDPFRLYLDDTPVFTGTLDAYGGFSGEFVFPADLPTGEIHFLTAQDSTGEFGYNITCPDVASIPTLSEWGMIITIGFMIVYGLWHLRRNSTIHQVRIS